MESLQVGHAVAVRHSDRVHTKTNSDRSFGIMRLMSEL